MRGRAEKRCGRKTRTGKPCDRAAGWGTSHHGEGACAHHGGASPQAEIGGLVALARREQQVMGRPLAIKPHDAILQCIQISAGEVAYASERMAQVEEEDAVAPVKRTLVRKTDDGTVQEIRLEGPALHVWIRVRRQAMDRLVSYSCAALKAGLEERQVKIAERQGVLLAQAVQGILRELGVAELPQAAGIVRKHLMLASGAGAG
jgi:hypothetical protein